LENGNLLSEAEASRVGANAMMCMMTFQKQKYIQSMEMGRVLIGVIIPPLTRKAGVSFVSVLILRRLVGVRMPPQDAFFVLW
jgi:hypothetical protein